MKGYLHIGTPKTATTTLQAFLNLNRAKLLDGGFIYTTAAGNVNNFNLVVAAYNTDRRDGLTKLNNIDSDSDLRRVRETLVENLKNEISCIAEETGEDGVVVFSSEYIQMQLTTPEEIKRLKQILHTVGISDISIIVYLRNPADLANSYYSTRVKAGGSSTSPPGPQEPRYDQMCNHKNTLENYSAVFGKENIVARIFEKEEFINNSIIDDFLNIIGSDSSSDKYELPDNSNSSLSSEGTALLCRLNNIFPRWLGNDLNPLQTHLVDYMESNYSDGSYKMPVELYQSYENYYSNSNEWVRKKFFPHKKALFSSKPYSAGGTLQKTDQELDEIAHRVAEDLISQLLSSDDLKSIAKPREVATNTVLYRFSKQEQEQYNQNLLHLAVGVSLYELGQHARAIEQCDLTLAADPVNRDALLYKAMSLSDKGERDIADNYFNKVISKYPDYYFAMYQYAICAENHSDWPQANVRWSQLLNKYPDTLEVLIGAGNSRYHCGMHAEAIECFDKAIQAMHENRNAFYGKAQCLIAMQQVDEAELLLLQAQDSFPGYLPVYKLYAEISQNLNLWLQAVQRWSVVVEKFPDSAPAALALGTCEYELGNYERAVEHFKNVLELLPSHKHAMLNLALCKKEQKHFQEAEKILLSAQSFHPDFTPLFIEYANLPIHYDDKATAAARWSEFSGKFPFETRPLMQAVVSSVKTDDHQLALELLDKHLAREPEHEQGLFLKAKSLIALGNISDAVDILKQGQENHPDNLTFFTEYAAIAAASEDWAEAADRWTKACEKFPGNLQLLLNAGECHRKSGNASQAALQLKEVISIDPTHKNGLMSYAMCEKELGQFDNAGQTLLKAQVAHPDFIAAFYEYANLPALQNDDATALSRWNTVAEKFPDDSRAMLQSALLCIKTEQYVKAIQQIDKLLGSQPDHQQGLSLKVKAHMLAALQLFKSCQYQETRAQLDQLLHIEPDHEQGMQLSARLHVQASVSLFKAEKFEAALTQLQPLLLCEPDHQQGLLIKAQSLIALNRTADAELVLQHAQTLEPPHPAFFSEYATISTKLENHAEAARRWGKSAERFPENCHFRLCAANSNKQAGEYRAAISHLHRILEHEPQHKVALLNKAQCLLELQEFSLAEKTLWLSISHHPSWSPARVEYAQLASKQDNWQEAVVRWQAALKISPELLLAHYHLALAHMKLQQFDDALTSLGRLLQLDSTHPAGLRNKALCLVELELFDEAEQIYLHAQSQTPRVFALYSEYAAIAGRQNCWQESFDRWKSIDAIFPNNPQVYFGAAVSLMKDGQYENAVTYFSKQLSLEPDNKSGQACLERCKKLLPQAA